MYNVQDLIFYFLLEKCENLFYTCTMIGTMYPNYGPYLLEMV